MNQLSQTLRRMHSEVLKPAAPYLYFYSQTIILYHSPPKSLHCNEGERGGAALRISELERV